MIRPTRTIGQGVTHCQISTFCPKTGHVLFHLHILFIILSSIVGFLLLSSCIDGDEIAFRSQNGTGKQGSADSIRKIIGAK
jgi:hypothetical protein